MTGQAFSSAYIQKPVRWNMVSRRTGLDLGDVVLEGGLRYDWYDSKAERPYLLDLDDGQQRHVQASTCSSRGRLELSAALAAVGEGTAPVRYGCPLTVFRQDDESHGYLSPHIQVSFPVTRHDELPVVLRAPGAAA